MNLRDYINQRVRLTAEIWRRSARRGQPSRRMGRPGEVFFVQAASTNGLSIFAAHNRNIVIHDVPYHAVKLLDEQEALTP